MHAAYFWDAIITYGCLKLKMYSYFSIENNITMIIIRIPFEPTQVYFTYYVPKTILLALYYY